MTKTVLAVVAALVAWFAIALGLGTAMRASWTAYAAVADSMTFTWPMMLARLALGVIATVAAGWLAARLAIHRQGAPLALGIVLLVVFIPQHVLLWEKFPLGYHAFFLISLIPLAMSGGRLAQPARGATEAMPA